MKNVKDINLVKFGEKKDYNVNDVLVYEQATIFLEELERIKIFERMNEIEQLGNVAGSKIPKKKKVYKKEYILLQLYLHQCVQKNEHIQLYYAYNGSGINFNNFYYLPSIESFKVTKGDIIQLLIIAYSVGHFYNTFISSQAIVEFLHANENAREIFLKQIADERTEKIARDIIGNKDYYHFHLINSLLILEKCNQNLNIIELVKCILYSYLKLYVLKENNKLLDIFDCFKKIRNLAIIMIDLPVSNLPLLYNYEEIEKPDFFKELLSKYNNTNYSNDVVTNIQKLLSDTFYYNERTIFAETNVVKQIKKKLREQEMSDYYNQIFIDKNSLLNKKHNLNYCYNNENVLKLKFSKSYVYMGEFGKLFKELEKISRKLEKMSFVRFCRYDRHNGEITFLITISSKCKNSRKVAFCIFKEIIFMLYRLNIPNNDEKYLMTTKFLLYYLFDERNIDIVQTVNNNCVYGIRGQQKTINQLKSILKNANLEKVERTKKHEIENMLNYLTSREERKKLTHVIVPASIKCMYKDNSMQPEIEFDGLILQLDNVNSKIVFLEAKKGNKSSKNDAKEDLKEKFKKLDLRFKDNEIILLDRKDAYCEKNILDLNIKNN